MGYCAVLDFCGLGRLGVVLCGFLLGCCLGFGDCGDFGFFLFAWCAGWYGAASVMRVCLSGCLVFWWLLGWVIIYVGVWVLGGFCGFVVAFDCALGVSQGLDVLCGLV